MPSVRPWGNSAWKWKKSFTKPYRRTSPRRPVRSCWRGFGWRSIQTSCWIKRGRLDLSTFLYWIWWICVSWCNLNITVLLHDSGSHFLLLYSWVGSTHEDLVERLRGVHFMKFVWHVQFWSLKSKIPRKRREAFNWFEDWKGIHIIWYYRPHAVPEADRKYLPKDSNWKLNSWVAVCHRPPGGAWRSAEAPLDLSAAKVSRLLLRVTVSTDLEVLQRKNEKWPAGWSTGGSSCCLVSTIPLSWWSLELPAGRWPVCLFRCWSGGAMLTGWWFGTFGLFFIIFPYIIYWE